jgi:uncharacterized protein (DUF4415 family)
MKKKTSKSLTREQLAELEAIAAMPDSAIDTSDAPEVLDWTGAKRGSFYRPIKQQLTLRLDADLVAWFKAHSKKGKGYQTRINQALREYVGRSDQQFQQFAKADFTTFVETVHNVIQNKVVDELSNQFRHVLDAQLTVARQNIDEKLLVKLIELGSDNQVELADKARRKEPQQGTRPPRR